MAKPDPMNVAIGARLSRFREKKGLTQAQLAERMGLAEKSVSRHENGTRGMNLLDATRYADVLGVPVDALVARVEREFDVDSSRTKPLYFLDEDALERVRRAQDLESLRELFVAGIEVGGQIPPTARLVTQDELGEAMLEVRRRVDSVFGGIPIEWLNALPRRRGDEGSSR